MADVERDCAHWLECGWVVTPQSGTMPFGEFHSRLHRPGSGADLPEGAVTYEMFCYVYQGHGKPAPYYLDDDD